MIFKLFKTESGNTMNMNTVDAHTMKAIAVEELAKKVIAQKTISLGNQTKAKPVEVPFDSELMTLANNPYLVEGHLQKWRCSAQ